MDEKGILHKIGQILYESDPVEAQKIIVRAELFVEGDGGRYEFDYVDSSGQIDWFDPDGRTVRELTNRLLELKANHINSGLCTADSPWSACVIELNLSNVRISFNMSYES